MTKKIGKAALMVISMLILFSSQTKAAGKEAVELRSVAEVEVTVKSEKGEKEIKRVEAAKANVAPGEVVIYTNFYANNGKEAATNIIVTNPVPEHMTYIDGTAEGTDAKVEFSVDKGKSYGTPDRLKIKEKDGKERSAAASEYTHIRWTLEKAIVPGGKGSVSFKAKVK